MSSTEWPPLPFREWEQTCDTVHMWTQIVGKTRMELSPRENHWWNVTLYVTPRGLTTSAIPCPHGSFDAEFDFLAHQLLLRTQPRRGAPHRPVPAQRWRISTPSTWPRSTHWAFEVHFDLTPAEFDDPTPYDQDRHHAAYDREVVERFHRVLIHADRVLKKFRARFIGKSSPVHFFWGSFDLAVSRFSGRRAPVAPDADPVTREAYSHEVISCGFWPGDRRFPQPAFYAYASPAPAGLETQAVRPGYWDTQMREFLLPYDDVRNANSPQDAVLDFCQSTYEAAARLAQWDRHALERE